LMLPGMVACTGRWLLHLRTNPEAVLTLTLRIEAGEECLMRISEQAAKQIAKVLSEFSLPRFPLRRRAGRGFRHASVDRAMFPEDRPSV
jgi:hypothetical protein